MSNFLLEINILYSRTVESYALFIIMRSISSQEIARKGISFLRRKIYGHLFIYGKSARTRFAIDGNIT